MTSWRKKKPRKRRRWYDSALGDEATTTVTPTLTAEQLWDANMQELCELVRGELRTMSPEHAKHGWIITNVLQSFFSKRR
jgi:hypothetical protein